MSMCLSKIHLFLEVVGVNVAWSRLTSGDCHQVVLFEQHAHEPLTSCHRLHLSKSVTSQIVSFQICALYPFWHWCAILTYIILFLLSLSFSLLFFLSETISEFSNWLPSSATITDMGRSVEGGQREEEEVKEEEEKAKRKMAEMKPERGLCWFEVPLTSVSYLSIPLPYAEIIVLQNCIPSLCKRAHFSNPIYCLLAMHICLVIRLISLDVLVPPAWRHLEFWWPSKANHPAHPSGWPLRLNKLSVLLLQNRISK